MTITTPLHWPDRSLHSRFSHCQLTKFNENGFELVRWCSSTHPGSDLCQGWHLDVVLCQWHCLWTSGWLPVVSQHFITGWCCCGCVQVLQSIEYTLPSLAATPLQQTVGFFVPHGCRSCGYVCSFALININWINTQRVNTIEVAHLT